MPSLCVRYASKCHVHPIGSQGSRAIPGSSIKSQIGHPQGASGAAGVAATLVGMAEGFLPATINLETPDPECDLDVIPNSARQAKVKLAISNAFGFGGHNTVLAIRKYD